MRFEIFYVENESEKKKFETIDTNELTQHEWSLATIRQRTKYEGTNKITIAVYFVRIW